jgi:hypothetical protein
VDVRFPSVVPTYRRELFDVVIGLNLLSTDEHTPLQLLMSAVAPHGITNFADMDKGSDGEDEEDGEDPRADEPIDVGEQKGSELQQKRNMVALVRGIGKRFLNIYAHQSHYRGLMPSIVRFTLHDSIVVPHLLCIVIGYVC